MTTTTPIGPSVPAIDPANVVKNSDGFSWREFFVRLPDGMIADDLKEPGIWRRIQKGPNAFRKHDLLFVVAYDESWTAEVRVASANASQAELATPRITRLAERYDKLFEDDTYRIVWNGAGYRVARKSDGVFVTPLAANAALAERDLRQMYAVRA